MLQQDGDDATYFVNGATTDTPGYLTNADITTLAAEGNEIGSHLYHHSDLAQLDSATVTSELKAASRRCRGRSGTPNRCRVSPVRTVVHLAVVDQIMAVHAYHVTPTGS